MSNVINFSSSSEDKIKQCNDRRLITTEVEVVLRRDNNFPMILHKNTGRLHEHANQFLMTRYYHCSFIDKKLDQVTSVTIKNYADHLRYWLNICSLLGTSYLGANYTFIHAVLATMRSEGTEESSISNYLATWRLFYQYLDKIGISHHMQLPAKTSIKRILSEAEQQGDFLNYTRNSNTVNVIRDPMIDVRRISTESSYSSQVLNIEQMKALISELRCIDIVYGLLAKVQFDTCLRISEIINYFSHTPNYLNPNFMSWGEMHINNIQLQKFNFIGKGQNKRQINLDIQTMLLIEKQFLSAKNVDTDITIYTQRKIKFQTDYLRTKLGKRSKYQIDSSVLWLTEEGHPVSVYMYQEAFRTARKNLYETGIVPPHINVRPHSMRHTGASLRLAKYRKETGVDIHIDNDGDIHAFLKDLLGHEKMETTHRYIRTVRSKTFANLALKTIIRNEDLWEDEIKSNPTLRRGVDAIKAFS